VGKEGQEKERGWEIENDVRGRASQRMAIGRGGAVKRKGWWGRVGIVMEKERKEVL
jgi:hypothetical protein